MYIIIIIVVATAAVAVVIVVVVVVGLFMCGLVRSITRQRAAIREGKEKEKEKEKKERNSFGQLAKEF